MSVTPFSIDKAAIAHLQDVPRDIFGASQSLLGVTRFYHNYSINDYGVGLDLSIVNDIAAAAAATVIIDNNKTVVIPAGGSFTINNIVWMSIEIPVQAGINVSVYHAGVSNDLIARLVR